MMIFHVFPRDRTFVSGRDKKGYLKHGTVQDGIERDNVDGIEISRDCTGRDWDTTGLHGTRLIYYRIARDGMKKRFDTVFVRYTASTSVSYDTIAFLVLLSYANVIGCHGMDELYPFIEWGAEKHHILRTTFFIWRLHITSCCSNDCCGTPHPPPAVDNAYLVNYKREDSHRIIRV